MARSQYQTASSTPQQEKVSTNDKYYLKVTAEALLKLESDKRSNDALSTLGRYGSRRPLACDDLIESNDTRTPDKDTEGANSSHVGHITGTFILACFICRYRFWKL